MTNSNNNQYENKPCYFKPNAVYYYYIQNLFNHYLITKSREMTTRRLLNSTFMPAKPLSPRAKNKYDKYIRQDVVTLCSSRPHVNYDLHIAVMTIRNSLIFELFFYSYNHVNHEGGDFMETRTSFFLCKNREELYRGNTYNDCLIALQTRTAVSWNWALTHEGYSIKETKEQLCPKRP